ncbi:unnamed protein product [Paramecium sonneborni]|uniref:HSF-type DNA-binding domain-containing protein n=1 Tax=Paramecium sonneborni TaxID=65129 RepID=A0A8S1R849_9CILI|nr:unnamed protein product [Paramecium sonneborni]
MKEMLRDLNEIHKNAFGCPKEQIFVFAKQIKQQQQQHMSKANKFIATLYKVLESKEYFNYVSWTNNGTSFMIHKLDDFQKIVLTECFNQISIHSFYRQMCLYGFRLKKKKGLKEYSHPNFIQGNFKELGLVQRKSKSHETADDMIKVSNSLKEQLQKLKEQQYSFLYQLKAQQEIHKILTNKIKQLLNQFENQYPEFWKQQMRIMLKLICGCKPLYGVLTSAPLYEILKDDLLQQEDFYSPKQLPFY